MLIAVVPSYFIISNAVEKEIGERALSVAKLTAKYPIVVEALENGSTTDELQELALEIQRQVGAEYVVIGDINSIRYAHPIKSRIGEKMVGDDNEKALIDGDAYISIAKGTLGEALRGKSPVFDEKGNVIGVVSVGFLRKDIFTINMVYSKSLIVVSVFTIAFSVLLAIYLSNKIKQLLLNYEPEELAKLFTERNAMVESIREGIIVVDTNETITFSNQAANEILNSKEPVVGKNIKAIIPNTRLIEVMKHGETQFDRVMYINNTKTLVNRVPIINNGKFIGAVSSFRPFEDIDHIADELSQVKQYIESLRAQTHEHNNFLYTISGLIQLQAYDEVLELIHQEKNENDALINFMNKHIRDMYLSGIIIGYYNRAKELKVKLILDESSYCDKLEMPIEKHLLISILGNLVINAFEAVEKLKEEQRIVRLYIFQHEHEIVFEIEDSGDGIDDNQVETIFELKNSTKASKNRGYGLHIVKENLKILNGSISIEKGDLGGALFIISIPKKGERFG
ncbi:ATP-binding protein [Bacillus sp. FJAT-27916]|uniref:ATP-binding protein n=1 Tax=Bacillus sp. FJAT-27916 TaxID=1679169 RepID=UPI001E46B3D0|nr:sensor histidine kinase [Bacillus sp. FJAT-27916]